MSQRYSFGAAVFFAVVAYIPSNHSLVPEKSFPTALPVIKKVVQTKVQFGSPSKPAAQHSSLEPSPCHLRHLH